MLRRKKNGKALAIDAVLRPQQASRDSSLRADSGSEPGFAVEIPPPTIMYILLARLKPGVHRSTTQRGMTAAQLREVLSNFGDI